MRTWLVLACCLAVVVGCKSFEKVDGGAGGSAGSGGSGGQNCDYAVSFKDDFERGFPQTDVLGSSQTPGSPWLQDYGTWIIAEGGLVVTGDEDSLASSPHATTGYRARLSFNAELSEANDEAGAGFLATGGVIKSGVYASIARSGGRTGIYEGFEHVESGPDLPAGEYFVELEISGEEAVMSISQNDYTSNGGDEYLALDTDGLSQTQTGSRFVVFMNLTSVRIDEVVLEAGKPCQ